jgi:predicted MPP superfamily phosphohydrolase
MNMDVEMLGSGQTMDVEMLGGSNLTVFDENLILEIGELFSEHQAYAVGDCVWHHETEGYHLYRFTSAHAAGAWNSSHVTATTVLDEILQWPKANPVFTGSISMGRDEYDASDATTATGENSVAVGDVVRASGASAFAEGSGTSASGDYSHAEGGGTTASNTAAHAEGNETTASGIRSHAEGDTTIASGSTSHAEGRHTVASGRYAHAEGNWTVASHQSQHVFGEFNTEDTSANAATARGNYVEIVGNGTASNARSNARALDWNGNERLRGDLYVNCNADSTGGSKVATESFVNDKISDSSSDTVHTWSASKISTEINKVMNAASDSMLFKGTIGGVNNPSATISSLPDSHSAGWTYRVVDADTYAGRACAVGDMIVCINTGTTANNDDWVVIHGNADGVVTGPSSDAAPNNTIALFDGNTGKLIKSSYTLISDLAPKNNPEFTGTISLGRKANTTSGTNSTAIGDTVTASGNYSHAEGSGTLAKGAVSHAEGKWTKALGAQSHAEGSSTVAKGMQSHSEGNSTIAAGNYSHAQGKDTIALSESSFVFGKYNSPGSVSAAAAWVYNKEYAVGDIVSNESHAYKCIKDHTSGTYNGNFSMQEYAGAGGGTLYTVWEDLGTDTKAYAEIVGKGSSGSRSNARTLDWDGNEFVAGKITVGSGPQGNMDVATKQYVDTAVSNMDTSALAPKANPEFTGSISLERKAGTTVGSRSVATGYNVEASGTVSHAEGNQTIATGTASHAEGVGTKVYANGSHTEGQGTVAYGSYQHVLGRYNIPSGVTFFPEWEPNVEYKKGDFVKHTETVNGEQVERYYVCSATTYNSSTFNNALWVRCGILDDCVEIVGGGSSDSSRLNLRALSTNGTEYLYGDVYVHCDPDGSNGFKVATENYVDSATETANIDSHTIIESYIQHVETDGSYAYVAIGNKSGSNRSIYLRGKIHATVIGSDLYYTSGGLVADAPSGYENCWKIQYGKNLVYDINTSKADIVAEADIPADSILILRVDTSGNIKSNNFLYVYTHIDKIENDITDIQNSMAVYNVPDYFTSHLATKVASINTAMNAARGESVVGANMEAFVFITDVHWSGNKKHSPSLIKYILNNTPIKTVICGGDIINGHAATKQAAAKEIHSFTDAITNIPCYEYLCVYGNHDNNGIGNNDDSTKLVNSEQLDLLYAPLSGRSNIHWAFEDAQFTWDPSEAVKNDYYVDHPRSKTRFLCVDWQNPMSGNRVAWMQKVLGQDDGYRVIVIHHGIYSLSQGEVVEDHSGIMSVLSNYKSKIVAVLSGHVHRDTKTDYYGDGSVPVITTSCDTFDTTYATGMVAGTVTEQCFDVVVVDYTNSKIKLIRVGNGSDREYDLSVTYTGGSGLAGSLTSTDIATATETQAIISEYT